MYYRMLYKNCWMSGSEDPDALFCIVSSGFTLFAQACLDNIYIFIISERLIYKV